MTNKTRHTPGPWWRDDDGFIAAGADETYVTIADFDCSLDIDIDEREANKSLAIASPDMLAALEMQEMAEADPKPLDGKAISTEQGNCGELPSQKQGGSHHQRNQHQLPCGHAMPRLQERRAVQDRGHCSFYHPRRWHRSIWRRRV